MDIETTACALYDGGWRADDYKQLKQEYSLTDDETEDICKYLQKLQDKNN